MEYDSRQWVHLAGIAAVFVVFLLVINLFFSHSPRDSSGDMRGYIWLATINMHHQADHGYQAIARGEASMIAVHRESGHVKHAQAVQQSFHLSGPPLLAILHVDHAQDALIDHSDALYNQLSFVTMVGDRYRVIPLAESPIRAVQVHREGGHLSFRAVLSNGRVLPMATAPHERVYNPALHRST